MSLLKRKPKPRRMPPRRYEAPLGILEQLRTRHLPGQRGGHRVSSAHLQAAYPFMAEGGLGGRGCLIGRDVYGGSFVYDPWELYGREITSPNMVVVGQLGSGKSAFIKSYLWRQLVFRRRAWVIDVKREYGVLAAAMGGTVVALRPNGDVRLNPLTPLAGKEQQERLLRAVSSATLGRKLSPEESGGLTVALEVVSKQAESEQREPTLPDVVRVLLRPTEAMAERLVTDEPGFARAVREVALGMQRLCEGDLAGMFDGPTTEGIDFRAPLVVLDLYDVYNSEALAILMTCATAWMQAHVDHDRAEAVEKGREAPKIIGVVDEAWRVFAELGIGEFLQSNFKLARQFGQQNIIVMHRFSDLRSAGAEGSREVRLAEGLLSDAETRVVYKQPDDQVEHSVDLLGLTETEAALLPTLARGQALWRVGQRAFLVQHRLSSLEEELVDTDAAMTVEQLERTPGAA